MKRLERVTRPSDEGFTLIELVMSVVIMGIITLPLANFVLSYFSNVTQTQNRLSDSHDIQIATAYFSQDVANTGLHGPGPTYAVGRSAWVPTSPPPAAYCGKDVGTLVLLLGWDSWTVSSGPSATGSNSPSSVAYVSRAGTLHRVYCAAGTATSSDTTVVHNLQAAQPQCSTPCDGLTPPARITLSLSISTGSSDRAAPAQPVTLTGQRRQT
jgi:prepilin-type N-terminal cleavage/methylation domain-containing protein